MTVRKTLRSQAVGWKFKIFLFFLLFFSPHPRLSLVVLHSFLGVPFMTVRLQVHSLFSLSTFFPDPFPVVVSIPPSPQCSTYAALAGKTGDQAFWNNCHFVLHHSTLKTSLFSLKCSDTLVEMKWNSSLCVKKSMLWIYNINNRHFHRVQCRVFHTAYLWKSCYSVS